MVGGFNYCRCSKAADNSRGRSSLNSSSTMAAVSDKSRSILDSKLQKAADSGTRSSGTIVRMTRLGGRGQLCSLCINQVFMHKIQVFSPAIPYL